jgi:methionyl aminopeptidase
MVPQGDIRIYNKAEIDGIRMASRLASDVLSFIKPHVQDGITTNELNELCHKYMIEHDSTPATLGYDGFPKSICTSVNHVVCHGIPSDYKLKTGDIVNVDVTVKLDGWFGDTSRTFMVGKCSRLAEALVEAAEEAMYIGIKSVRPLGYFGDIGRAIQSFVNGTMFSIVRDYCGHGIGSDFHMPPTIPHFGFRERGGQILPGMCFTIEPMLNVGSHKTRVLKDGWTAITVDKSLSAQFEHTIVVTEDAFEILTGSNFDLL